MESKIEILQLIAPNVKYFKYELWKKSSFWGNDSYFLKLYDKDSNSKTVESSIEDWTTIKYGIKLINDIFDYKMGDFHLQEMKKTDFKSLVNSLYGADIASISYDYHSTYCHLKYKDKGSLYYFDHNGKTFCGISADIEFSEACVIARENYKQNTTLITYKNLSYVRDIVRIYWGLALWRSAYIGGMITHKYFVFNNPNLILDETMQRWLSMYKLVNYISESDWI